MKKWFLNRFLPMWAKETVLRDNARLRSENEFLLQRIGELESYIRGFRTGMRLGKRSTQ